jgi:hypothetical protein
MFCAASVLALTCTLLSMLVKEAGPHNRRTANDVIKDVQSCPFFGAAYFVLARLLV